MLRLRQKGPAPSTLLRANNQKGLNMKIKAEFIFPGTLKDKPIIWHVSKNFDVIVKILEASFSTDTGWAILILDGSEKEIKKTFNYLSGKGIEIKNKQVMA